MLAELWSDVRYRLRAIVHRRDVEQELADELRFHLERETEKYIRLGIAPDEAGRRARLAFGGTERTKDESRDARGTALLEAMIQDTRYAIRGLRARPAFTAGVLLTLALGIGANTAMFGVVDRMLLRAPRFLRDADRVERVYEQKTIDRSVDIDDYFSFPRYLDYQRLTRSFDAVVGYTFEHMAVGDGDATRQRPIVGASGNFFSLFSARPALGRFFTPADDSALTGAPVVVLGYQFWQTSFGGRAGVLGQKIRVGRTLCTIIGVAPDGFAGLEDDELPALFFPLTTMAWNNRSNDYTKRYGWRWFQLVVVRKPGVDARMAAADLTAALRRSWLAQNNSEPRYARPLESVRPQAIVGPIHHERGPIAGEDSKVVLWITAVAAIVLLIACANVANLLLARAATRRREIALRLALGVSRGRLVRHLITESAVLAVAGALLGLVVAQWGGRVINALFFSDATPMHSIADPRTLTVTAIIALGVAIATGLAPASHALREDVAASLAAGSRDTDARSSRMRNALFVLQATLSVVLLVGAGLFVRSLRNVQRAPLGFDVDPIIVVTLNSRGTTMSTDEGRRFEAQLSAATDAIPGVVSATPAPTIPYWAYEGRDLFVDGVDSVGTLGNFVLEAGNPDLFRTLGIRLLAGRGFNSTDRDSTHRVMVVSAGMANALWPGQRAIGKCVRIDADTAPCTEVVGIAQDTRVRTLHRARQYTYYLPITQYADRTSMLFVRVAGSGADFTETIRRELQRHMPGASYVVTTPFADIIAPNMRSWRLGATMFTAFGALALLLAAVGLYSLVAYAVVERRREIGIRLALGATREHVVGMIVRGGLRLLLPGLLLGSAIALLAGRKASSLLFEESATDPAVYVAVGVVLLVTAIIALVQPAVAAARVDPNRTLRD